MEVLIYGYTIGNQVITIKYIINGLKYEYHADLNEIDHMEIYRIVTSGGKISLRRKVEENSWHKFYLIWEIYLEETT